ncbi:MAG: 30S ribosome-binding factor RbfA [Mariprofundaceae bacterium]|nr:30S ribosome-binding factor RbfA [Mariprofundaceae bacterium]
MKNKNNQRLQRDIQRLLTQLLQRDVDDPSLAMITLTDVSISQGAYDAVLRVYSHEPDVVAKDCITRLNRMVPHFEYALRQALKRRTMPHLQFVWDEGMDKTASLMQVLRGIQDD